MEAIFTEKDLEPGLAVEPPARSAPSDKQASVPQQHNAEPSLFDDDELPIPGLDSPEMLRQRLFGEPPQGALILDGGSPVPQVGASAPAWTQAPIIEDEPFPKPSAAKSNASSARESRPMDSRHQSIQVTTSTASARADGPKLISSPQDVLRALQLKRAAIPKAFQEASEVAAKKADPRHIASAELPQSPVKSVQPAGAAKAVKKKSRKPIGTDAVEFVREDGLTVSMDAETCRDPELLRRVRRMQTSAPLDVVTAAQADEALGYVRDDGLVVEVDGDTCTDPSIFREAKRKRAEASGRQPRPRPPLSARAVAALARREYSRRELRRKLLKTLEEGETIEALDSVLDDLEAKGFLSDERYASVRARSFAPRMGDARIRRELRLKGVDEETARDAVASLEEPEALRAYRVWSRRYDELPKNWKEREKQVRYLAYRGFSMSAIFQVLRGEVTLPEDEERSPF